MTVNCKECGDPCEGTALETGLCGTDICEGVPVFLKSELTREEQKRLDRSLEAIDTKTVLDVVEDMAKHPKGTMSEELEELLREAQGKIEEAIQSEAQKGRDATDELRKALAHQRLARMRAAFDLLDPSGYNFR